MASHYIKRHYGCDHYYCDNSWKRLQRYNAGHGDTMIFNFGCGCGHGGGMYTGGICGGGSFWGGFGAGIGNGIANLLTGFLGGFMSMPMFGGGMFSMSMPMFGGFNMYPGVFGFGGSSSSTTSKTPRVLGAPDDTTPGENEGKAPVENPVTKTSTNTPVETIIDKLGDRDITTDDIEKLVDDINSIPADKKPTLVDKLKAKLADFRINETEYKCPLKYDDLKALELLCDLDDKIIVKVEHRDNASDIWIKGPIKNVKKDNDTITYDVDCTKTGKIVKAVWTLKQTKNGDTYSCKPEKAVNQNGTALQINDVTYTYNSSAGHWENKDKLPSISYENLPK